MKRIDLEKAYVRTLLPQVPVGAHKGTQGHTLVVGGSYGKIGSICMTAMASLKAGSGLVTAFLPKCGFEIIQTSVPEVMAVTDRKSKYITDIAVTFEPDAIAIGPGMGIAAQTQAAFLKLLALRQVPLVIDADGLNILAKKPEALLLLKRGDVLTPHPKELERLLGPWRDECHMLQIISNFADKHGAIIVAKGSPTYIADGENIYQNTIGNPGLATAGSGDVLTGLVAGLMAQKLSPLNSAIVAVYLHALAADIGVLETGIRSFVASDILKYVGRAFIGLEDVPSKIQK